MSYIVLRVHWCSTNVLNVNVPSVETSDDPKDSFYEELEKIFDHLPKYHMEILLEDFKTKLRGGEDIFKSTIGNDSLYHDSNDNGVRTVNSATLTNLVLRARCSRTETFISTPVSRLMGTLKTRLITY